MLRSADSHEVETRGFRTRPTAGRRNKSDAMSATGKFAAQCCKRIQMSVEIRADKSNVHDSKAKRMSAVLLTS